MNIAQLVCFKNEGSYCIVNLNTYKVVRKGEGRFFWRGWDEYLLINDGHLALYDLGTDQPKQIYDSSVKMIQIQVGWQDIQFNASKTLFATISYSPFIMHVTKVLP